FAVTRSRAGCESIAAARMPIGEPSTVYFPGRPNLGIAQPCDVAVTTRTASRRQWSPTRLTPGTRKPNRIHESPKTSHPMVEDRSFARQFGRSSGAECPCRYTVCPLERKPCRAPYSTATLQRDDRLRVSCL